MSWRAAAAGRVSRWHMGMVNVGLDMSLTSGNGVASPIVRARFDWCPHHPAVGPVAASVPASMFAGVCITMPMRQP